MWCQGLDLGLLACQSFYPLSLLFCKVHKCAVMTSCCFNMYHALMVTFFSGGFLIATMVSGRSTQTPVLAASASEQMSQFFPLSQDLLLSSLPIFKKILTYFFVFIGVSHMCVSVHHMHAWCLQRPEGLRCPVTRVKDSCGLPCKCWNPNLGSLK